VIGNPGYFSNSDEQDLLDQIDALDPTTDAAEITRLETRLDSFRKIRQFDKPQRNYTALELTGQKRFSRNFYVQSSYTYSRTRGNYPGLVNDDRGEALPNFSTQYDLAELLANHYGPLPQDRPHYFKFDGFYTHDMKAAGRLTGGVRFRAFSGTPLDALGSNFTYGFGVTQILPRGSQGRNEFVTGTDLHASYERTLARGYGLPCSRHHQPVQPGAGRRDRRGLAPRQHQPHRRRQPGTWCSPKLDDNSGLDANRHVNKAYGTAGPLHPLYFRIGARLSFTGRTGDRRQAGDRQCRILIWALPVPVTCHCPIPRSAQRLVAMMPSPGRPVKLPGVAMPGHGSVAGSGRRPCRSGVEGGRVWVSGWLETHHGGSASASCG
jgi:hypothetical protein